MPLGERRAENSPLQRKFAVQIQGKQRQTVVQGLSRAVLSYVP